MLIAYLASAVLFYFVVAGRAPVTEDAAYASAEDCEVIELYATSADQSASRAA